MKFSILLPVKATKNAEALKGSLDSVLVNIDRWKETEVILGIDPKDTILPSFEHVLKTKKVVISQQDGVVAYYNALKDSIEGDVVLLWSDENIMQTPHWDTVLRKKIKQLRTDIWLGRTFDYVLAPGGIKTSGHPLNGRKFACYPVIPKKLIDTLGYVLPSQFRSWGADLMLDNIMNNVNRVIPMDEIKIQTFWVDQEVRWTTYNEDVERMVKEGAAIKNGDNLEIKVENELALLKKAIKEERIKRRWTDYLPSFKSFDY